MKGPGPVMSPDEVDFRGDASVLFELLHDQPAWRERVCEQVDYASTLLTVRRKVVHVRPLVTASSRFAIDGKTNAWIDLPVGLFPRRLFFEFEVKVAGVEAYRMGGADNVELLADYMTRLAWLIGTDEVRRALSREDVPQWLFAICRFRAAAWQQARRRYPKKQALLRYLQDGLCPPAADGSLDRSQLDAKVLEVWQAQVAGMARAVRMHAMKDVDSPAENPLLVLPVLKANGIIEGIDEVSGKLASLTLFFRSVEAAEKSGGVASGAACDFFTSYAMMGRYWMVLVSCLVPLNRPFIVEVNETRAVDFGYRQSFPRALSSTFQLRRKDLGPLVVFRDATSNHVTVRVTDPNVELKKGVQVKPEAGDMDEMALNTAQQKGEIALAYSSDRNRANVVHVKMTLRPSVAIRAIHWTVALIVLFTGVSFLVAWNYVPGYFSATHVAWLLTPSTFATSLLLARESSALSSALAKNLRVLLATVLLILWMLGFSLYLTDHLHLTEKTPTSTPTLSTTHPRPEITSDTGR